MRVLKCQRGGQQKPKVLKTGDKYDSIIYIYDDGALIKTFPYVNTDMSINFKNKSGILSEGTYAYLCTETDKLGKSLILFNQKFYNEVKSIDDITTEMQTLPSLIPNPNWKNQYIMRSIFVHKGGTLEWDWSQGCVTIFGDDYNDFIQLFKMGEKGLFEMTRAAWWKEPAVYKKKLFEEV